MWKTGSYRCSKCEHVWHELVTKEEFDDHTFMACQACGALSPRILAMPAVMSHAIASGTNESKRFTTEKQIGRLKADYAQADSTDKETCSKLKAEAESIRPGASHDFKN